jgi:hypothetical protein
MDRAKKPNKSQIVREILANNHNLPAKEAVARARALGYPSVTTNLVYAIRGDLNRLKKNRKISQSPTNLPNLNFVPKPPKYVPLVNPNSSVGNYSKVLNSANEFMTQCGNIDEAIEVLQALKELQIGQKV